MTYPTVYPTGVTVYDPKKSWSGYTIFQAKDVGALLIDMNGGGVQLCTARPPAGDHRGRGPTLPGEQCALRYQQVKSRINNNMNSANITRRRDTEESQSY